MNLVFVGVHDSRIGRCGAMRAYVLVRFEADYSRQVISDLRRLKGLISADLVTGPYDAVVAIEAADMNEIAELVVAGIGKIPGIASTITCQSVEAY